MPRKWHLVCKIKSCNSKSGLSFSMRATILILSSFFEVSSKWYPWCMENSSKIQQFVHRGQMVAFIKNLRALLLLQLLILHTRHHFSAISSTFRHIIKVVFEISHQMDRKAKFQKIMAKWTFYVGVFIS